MGAFLYFSKGDYMEYLIIINTISLLLLIYILVQGKIKEIRSKKNIKKEVEVVTTLTEKKLKDDIDLEKDKDLVLIDEYMKFLKAVIEKYNSSRSKRIAYTTRQALLGRTVAIIPVFSKYISIDFFYDPEDATYKGVTDRDLMMMLESTYNDFTHDNLDCFNSILSVVMRLRDDK